MERQTPTPKGRIGEVFIRTAETLIPHTHLRPERNANSRAQAPNEAIGSYWKKVGGYLQGALARLQKNL